MARAKYCKCLYVHRKKTDNSVFYVGIGNKYRPKAKDRNNLWKKISDKYGYKVEVIMTGLSLEKAVLLEKELISYYGRKNNNTGVLANLTDGGEGQVGRVVSEKTRTKIRESKVANGMKGGYNVVDKSTGIKYHSLRNACIELGLKEGTVYPQLNGKRKRSKWNNLYYEDKERNKTKTDARSRRVVDLENNKSYKSIKEAANCLNVNIGTLSQHLNGFRYKESLKNIKLYE